MRENLDQQSSRICCWGLKEEGSCQGCGKASGKAISSWFWSRESLFLWDVAARSVFCVEFCSLAGLGVNGSRGRVPTPPREPPDPSMANSSREFLMEAQTVLGQPGLEPCKTLELFGSCIQHSHYGNPINGIIRSLLVNRGRVHIPNSGARLSLPAPPVSGQDVFKSLA